VHCHVSARPAPPVRRAAAASRTEPVRAVGTSGRKELCQLRGACGASTRHNACADVSLAILLCVCLWFPSLTRYIQYCYIDGSGNSLKKRQRTTVRNVTPLQSTVDLPTPAGAASEKATRRERGPARQCVPVDSTESFEIVPVTLWSLCRAPGLLGLLSVGGVSVVLCLSVARIQCAREERERGYGHRLESPCVRPPYARQGHLLEGSGR